MKTTTVTYLHSNDKEQVQRYVLYNEHDVQTALKEGLIMSIHLVGIHKILSRGDCVVLNEFKGYCGAEGTWEIHEPDADRGYSHFVTKDIFKN